MSNKPEEEVKKRREVPREAFKVSEAAAALGVSECTIRRLIKRGEIRACRVLRHVLIPKGEIQKLLEE